MALIRSTAHPETVEIDGAIYKLRIPTPYTWTDVLHAVRRRGIRPHSLFDRVRCMKDGLAELLAGDAQGLADRSAELDDYVTAIQESVPQDEDGRKALAERQTAGVAAFNRIATELRRVWPLYAEMEADNERADRMTVIEAVRLHLAGIGDTDYPQPPPESDFILPEEHIGRLYDRLEALRRPTETEAKNSRSPSRSPSATATSTTPTPNGGPKPTPPARTKAGNSMGSAGSASIRDTSSMTRSG